VETVNLPTQLRASPALLESKLHIKDRIRIGLCGQYVTSGNVILTPKIFCAEPNPGHPDFRMTAKVLENDIFCMKIFAPISFSLAGLLDKMTLPLEGGCR
jgi:hypothetical protein